MFFLWDAQPGVPDHIPYFRVGRRRHDENEERGRSSQNRRELLLQGWASLLLSWAVKTLDGIAKQEGKGIRAILVNR